MKKRLLPLCILVAYSVFLIKWMVFKDVPTIRVGHLMLNFGGTDASGHANFVPFKTILPYLLGYKGLIIAGINLIGNIALLVPLGILVPFVYRNMTWKKSLALGVVTGLAIEITQTVLRVGIFDIDDVLLNALGVLIGYGMFAILAKWVRSKNYTNILMTAIVGIAAILLLYGFVVYPMTHMTVSPEVDAISHSGLAAQAGDLCGGTGGTGEIISQGDHTITIKRNDNVVQNIHLTDQTDIRNSKGPIPASDLKIGDRVTIVIYDSITATTVLVCSATASETQSM